jgi:hypothetical protein
MRERTTQLTHNEEPDPTPTPADAEGDDADPDKDAAATATDHRDDPENADLNAGALSQPTSTDAE